MKMTESSPNRVENIVGKGGIAHYEQFLLFPQCFQKTCTADMLKQRLFWERVKALAHNVELKTTLNEKAFEKY